MAWKVSGPTKRVAAGVIATRTAPPPFTTRRAISQALYAAMPPPTHSTTVRFRKFMRDILQRFAAWPAGAILRGRGCPLRRLRAAPRAPGAAEERPRVLRRL